MNKKFSTLVAGLLLAGSLPITAQYCPTNGEVPYRTRLVKAATLDATFKDVTKINKDYYYQLQVNPVSLGIEEESSTDFVLTAERDYSTGKLYLTAQPVTNATLTHSLWQIKAPANEVDGRLYSFVNKETGFELTFDHVNALQVDKDGNIKFDKANKGWDYDFNGLMDGCNKWWSWYTTDAQTNLLDYRKVYSYFHNADSVMYLSAVKQSESGNYQDLYNKRVVEGLSENGLDGTATNGFAIITKKNSKEKVGTYLTNVSDALQIKPVVAGAKVLDAAEINSMVDADKSYMTFEDIDSYTEWSDAKKGKLAGKSTKFTVCKPGTKDALTIAEGANPFLSEYVALESVEGSLKRDAAEGSLTNYAGYNILFETKEPTLVAGDQKQKSYLYVHEHNYEGTESGVYNGLKVVNQPYAYLTLRPTVNDEGRFGDNGKKRVFLNYAEAVAAYRLDNPSQSDKANSATTMSLPDPLEARYLWKVTYYATNDSLVLEPLNASRMNQDEMNRKLPFEKTHLAQENGEGVWAQHFFNTVNAGVEYSGTNSTSHEANSMYNKAAGVPVALYAINNSILGDDKMLLTVGAASNIDKGVNANDVKWAAVKKTEAGNPAYVTNKENGVYQSEMKLTLRFDNNYTYLQRATVADGVYFINLNTDKYSTSQTENRVNGAYLVADMKGHLVYDVAQNEQDFSHMPATQWVVEQKPCVVSEGLNVNEYPVVSIYNREFGYAKLPELVEPTKKDRTYSEPAFEGQLYKTAEGKLFTINHRDYARDARQQNVDRHAHYYFNCADTVSFDKLAEVNTLGYFNEKEDVLRDNVYQLQNIFDMAGFRFLGIDNTTASIDTLQLLAEGATEFELFRAEGWYPVAEKKTEIVNGEVKETPTGTYRFEYTDSIPYGYTSSKAGASQLYKTAFKLKLKDTNLIDNDHKFVAINNQHKYVVALESEINNPKNQLSYAIVTLKENNEVEGEHCYALVNAEQYTIVNGISKEDLKGLKYTEVEDENGFMNPTYYIDVDANDGETFNPEKDKVMVTGNNMYQISGKLVIEGTTLDAKIADLCETTSSVFKLVNGNRPVYRTLDAELVNNMKKVVDIRTIDRQGNESLFEDSSSKEAQRWNMNYLGAENMGDPTSREGLYVDKVAKSNARMPQYLFVVAADSVPAYRWCNETLPTGEPKHGVNPSCGHDEDYAGYVEGRFLVNFNDSVKSAIDKVTNADKFKSDNYVRLGFVEAVHRGDTLYILKAPYTLASIKVASEDPADNGKMFIRPDYLAPANAGIVYDAIVLDGTHNNAAFALRNTDDPNGQEEGEFIIESNDINNKSQIGAFAAGAWLKIINNVPVLAQYYNKNGDHNTGDSTDSWIVNGDYAPVGTFGEVINQSARFVISGVDKDGSTTDNEEIEVDGISVVGVNGAIVVKGAAGKTVVVNNILGQTVATSVAASDNATITVPAGIVVVTVDGEEAVKTVVK